MIKNTPHLWTPHWFDIIFKGPAPLVFIQGHINIGYAIGLLQILECLVFLFRIIDDMQVPYIIKHFIYTKRSVHGWKEYIEQHV